jgi:hypothetical protein
MTQAYEGAHAGAFALSSERRAMSDREWETGSGEEDIDEQGRNLTQQRLDEEGTSSQPVDIDENAPTPHEGEEGQDLV